MPRKNKVKPSLPSDPRQPKFLTYFFDPKSETFGNALQSALRAEYSQEYSENITSLMPKWLSESIGDDYMLKKAESNLKDFLEMDITNRGVTKDGKEVYEFDDTGKLRVKADVTKFIAERIGRKKYGNEQKDSGDKEGMNITFILNSFKVNDSKTV